MKQQLDKKRDIIVIVCAPRSGSAYISKVLQEAGLIVRHEKRGRDGSVNWRAMVHASNDRAGYTYLHQVRHPLHAISSIQTAHSYSWNYIRRFIDLDDEWGIVYKSMFSWYHWNLMAHGNTRLTYRVENIENVWPKLCDLIGIEKQSLPMVRTNLNTRRERYTLLTWDDLYRQDYVLTESIKELAKKYGYVIE